MIYIVLGFHKNYIFPFINLSGGSTQISSYDLFVLFTGIECAMFPVLYPTTDFTDTGIREHYKHHHNDDSNRVISIGLSWTHKVLSSVRVYAEQRDLPFFLYEKYLAGKFFQAQCRAQQMGVTGHTQLLYIYRVLVFSVVCCLLFFSGFVPDASLSSSSRRC